MVFGIPTGSVARLLWTCLRGLRGGGPAQDATPAELEVMYADAKLAKGMGTETAMQAALLTSYVSIKRLSRRADVKNVSYP